MNSPIHSSVEHAFVLLLGLRQYCGDHSLARYMSVDGFIQGLYWADVITNDQYQSLTRLASECFCNAGRPFPSPVNLGPVMPALLAYERSRQPVAPVGKPQAPVVANERDKQVSEVGAPRQLRLLCLLVNSSNAPARYLPVHTMRPMPPRVCAADSRRQDGQGQWRVGRPALELVHNTGLHLREARATAPTPEVLARCVGHRQANSVYPNKRSFSFGVTQNVC